MTDPALVVHVGNVLWGRFWRSQMARYLLVDPSTIHKWQTGQAVPKRETWEKLARAVEERRQEMTKCRALLAPRLARRKSAAARRRDAIRVTVEN